MLGAARRGGLMLLAKEYRLDGGVHRASGVPLKLLPDKSIIGNVHDLPKIKPAVRISRVA